MSKSATTVTIDNDVKKVARAKKINMSAVSEAAIRLACEGKTFDSSSFGLVTAKKRLTRVKYDIQKGEADLVDLKELEVSLVEDIKYIEVNMNREKTSKDIATMTRQMNEIIEGTRYEPTSAFKLCKDHLKQLKELGYGMSKKEFEAHVSRLESIRG